MDVVAELSRPLEFRAWHLPSKRMYYGVFFDLDHVYLSSDDSPANKPLKREECVLMQYTGRECEKGHKLFEGDILRYDHTQPLERIARGDEEYTAYYWIKYHLGAFVIFNMGKSDTHFFSDGDELSNYRRIDQRVGNVFETPDMLELTDTYPLHLDAIRNHEKALSEQAA